MGAAVTSTRDDDPPPTITTCVRTRCAIHYPVDARPRVLVRHQDGVWHEGRLHAWLRTRRPPGWRAMVSYSVGAGLQYYLDVPADRVKRQGPTAPPTPR